MRILALERDVPRGAEPPEISEATARAEAARVWELYQEGVVREMYFRADRPLAALILESATVEDAIRVIASLPLVQAGAIEFEVVPLRAYPGFARLFAETT